MESSEACVLVGVRWCHMYVIPRSSFTRQDFNPRVNVTLSATWEAWWLTASALAMLLLFCNGMN